MCRNKLEKLRLEKYSDTATFFSEFQKSVNELKSAGAKIREKDKLNYMLNTLPNQYSYIGNLIDTLKEENQTASYVKNKIHIAEINNREHGEQRSNVLAAKKDEKGSCFKCCGTVQFAGECQNGGQAGQNSTTWRGSTHGRGRGKAGRGNYGRERVNFRQQTASTSEQNGEGASAWIATAHAA